jgi:hypothetical protein
MDTRPDISDKLIHFTSGVDADDAFARLRNIVYEQRLIAGTEKIKGGYSCVCFTEAPIEALPYGFVNLESYSRYSPFGILFEKAWIFGQGGRPVIYQPDSEFHLLPEEIRWRHVRYEPGAVDFTWEREWRMHCDELSFHPEVAVIVVPSDELASFLVGEHEAEQESCVVQYSQVIEESLAEQYREPYPWRICVLN